MGRGLGWLVGALVLAGLAVLALSGLCRRADALPGLSNFFCPRPQPAPDGPAVPPGR